MKKILLFGAVLTLLFSLTACQSQGAKPSVTQTKTENVVKAKTDSTTTLGKKKEDCLCKPPK